MSGDIIDQAQSAFNGKPYPKEDKPKKRYPTPVCVRFSEEERALLEEKAGDLTTSAYVRLCVLGEDAPKHRTRSKKAVEDHQALGQLLGSLGSSNVPNNLNQLSKAVHNGDLPLPDDIADDLKQAAFEIAYMRHMLMSALGLASGNAEDAL
ncbi:MAG: hypothetical protein L3J04_00640 [Robiginitomaculum sp.]|nr:hypothetical protein [Robiginitomaculum sp.]